MAEATSLGSLAQSKPTPRRQMIATRGNFPTLIEGGSANTRLENHIFVTTGPQACSSIRVHYASFRSRETEDSVLSVSTATLQTAFVFNSQFVPVSVGGTTSTTLEAGVTMITTNPVGVYLPAHTEFLIKTGIVIAASTYVAAGISATNKTVRVASTSATSQIFSRFNVSTPSGGTTTTLSFFPVMITGIPQERHPAVIIWGDSLSAGVGDVTTDANGAVGCMEKACMNVYGTGKHMPFSNFSKSGDVSTTYEADEAQSRFAFLEFATHVLFSLGSNDIGSGRTAAQIKASMQEAWAHARIFGLTIGAMTLPPRTTSTDSWATTANQTVVAGYASNSIRGEINAWLREQLAAGAIDFLVDVSGQVTNTSGDPDKWNAGATYDGTHYTPATHDLLATYIRGIFATFRV